tara:strand:+ start:875 stop:1084 length:210 start_codon:yes stop_codon:yes gene_type:complete
MAGKAKTVKEKPKSIVVETPPPPKTPKKDKDVEYIGNELANVSKRINELELAIEDMNQKLKRVMGRMGL